MLNYALLMLAAGVGVPVLAALNAALGKHIAAPFVASIVLFTVALICSAVVVLIQGGIPMAKLIDAPKHLFLAGCLIAFYVLSITFVAPRFGIGNAVFFVLLGQLVSAAIIDHFGLFGAPITQLNFLRGLGIFVMAAGVWVTQLAAPQ